MDLDLYASLLGDGLYGSTFRTVAVFSVEVQDALLEHLRREKWSASSPKPDRPSREVTHPGLHHLQEG